jgi:ankyrin repeat protein
MLCRTRNQSSLDTAFVKEVRAVVAIPLEPRELGSVQSLLAAGADVNAQQGAALRTAVSAADARVTELLLHAKPNSASLALALPHALKIPDRMNRLTFTEQLIHAGATAAEANRALVHAINKFPDDVSLLRVLASYADVSDGEALSSAVQQARVDIVKILLIDGGQRYSTITLNNIFIATATQIADRPKRLQICNLLLDVGVSGPAVSDALLGAAADGDTALGAALLRKGSASVEHCDGRAIVEACRAGAVDVLAMLLDSPATLKNKTLAQGFQGATQVRDLNKRAQMFHMLLKKGVTGEVVDAQLVSAARFGNEGQPMVKLLLKYGADVNYNNGEAVWTATRSAILGSLALMLGVDGFGRRQKKPLPATIAKALKASWTLSRDPRYQVIQWVLGSASSLTQEQLDTMLVKAVKNEPDLRLVELLLTKGASPDANGCESLIEAAQHRLLDILPALLKARVSETDLAWTFSQAFTPANREAWHADDGYEAMQMLLAKGALGNGSAIALSTAISAYGTNREPVARRFVELLTGYNVDVNHDSGIMLQTAAKRGDQDLVRRLLSLKPNSRTVSMAFPHIFNHSLAEDELLILIKLFTEYRHDQERLDIMSVHPQCQPVMYQALSLFPRSVNLVQALLDAGFYHDHKTMARVMPGDIDEEEQISLFVWALLQPQKRVSDSVLELLIDRGADVNFETRLSKTTPLMLAVQNKRKEVMRKLLLAGAEADVVDATGNTPLTMATKIGGDIGTSMMRDLLIVETFKNDGSLHNAVRELNLAAVEELVEASHELDFPSPLHSGRSALAELCLNAAHTGPLTASQEKAMEKTMTYLISHGTDLTLHASGKSPLLLAFDSVDPLPTTRALLKVGMWKHVNAPSNQYTHDNHVYSPTQYLLRLLPQSDTTVSLISLLYANRAADTYYALTGPQPPDAINPPPDILAAERARTARQEARAFAEQDHRLQLARTRESAELQDQIFLRRVDLEDSKARRELAFLRERGQVEDDLFAAQIRRQRETQTLRLSHETELGQVGARNARMLGDAEAEVQAQKQRGQLEWERQMGAERVKGEKEMAALRVRERGDVDRIDERASKRTIGRIEAQRKLVEKQDALAARFASTGGVRPSQIGWVDELD